jgi:hypothetical protein
MTKQIYFINEQHKEQYGSILDKTCYPHDRERTAMFYIIAGNRDLFPHINSIYDFNNEELKIDSKLGKLKVLCSSSKALLKLALNLYNSAHSKQSVYETFYCLDNDNKLLACEAIKIRFNF